MVCVCVCACVCVRGGGFNPENKTVSPFFSHLTVHKSQLSSRRKETEGVGRRMADLLQVSFVPPLTVHGGGGEAWREGGRGVAMVPT